MNESQPLPPENTGEAIERIRAEVARRKGSEADLPPLPAPRKKTALQKAVDALDRARGKHLQAARWPRLLRPLRRNQEAIDEALISAAEALVRETEQIARLTGPLAMQQSALLSRVRALSGRVAELEARVEKLSPPASPDKDITG
ncbi:MAG: hypothetical protein ACFUZC_23420 [Chthoniobacteraceae bacterium]